jgi:hypothetical protein
MQRKKRKKNKKQNEGRVWREESEGETATTRPNQRLWMDGVKDVGEEENCLTLPALSHHEVSLASQIPVEALLNALKPEPELHEAPSRLKGVEAMLGAKVAAKVAPVRRSGSKASKPKIKPEIRTSCNHCRRTHFKCDSQKPACGRCVSKGWAHLCSYEAQGDSLSPPKNLVPRQRKKPPVQKPGFSASGAKLCEHGLEKRYCLHPACVSNGGGKAMCKHNKRKRSCTHPECVKDTEERRRQIAEGRCKHGVQMRCCTQDECRVDFQLAGQQYREKLKERKRPSSDDGISSDNQKPKSKRGRPPGPRLGTRRIAGIEGEADLNDGADKVVHVATTMSLSGQEGVVASIQEGGLASVSRARDTLAAKEAAGMLVPAAHLAEELNYSLLLVRATRSSYEMLPEEAKVGEDLGAVAAEAQSEAPSENVFSSHFKSNKGKAGEDLCAVGAEAQSELRSEHARSQHARNFHM